MKVTVVGAGAVGATCADNIARKQLCDELVLVDIKEGVAEGKAMDLMQTAAIEGFDTRIRSTLTGKIVSPLFQVTSMVRALSTPFSFAQTLAAARAVLFCPNSITEYKLPSIFKINPERISAVVAMLLYF